MKISVITASYNAAATLGDAICSLGAQSHKDVEHIVIDGASTDGTKELVRSYSGFISEFISEPDSGIYDAMNKGIARASGDIVGTLNADDVYADNYVLARVAEAFKDPSVLVSYGDLIYVAQGDLTRPVRVWKSRPYEQGLFLSGWVPPHPTFFVRRSVYERYGAFDLAFPLAADFELMLRYLHNLQLKSAYIPEVLVKMRLGGATNKSLGNILRQNIDIYNAGRKNGVPLGVKSFSCKLYDRFRQYMRAR